MVFMALAVLLILAIAFFQIVQGLFSALIMTVLTVLCAALAMGYYENLAGLLYSAQPAHADAAALLAMFVLPLLGLRLLFDRYLRANVVFGVWSDRIGGGILGLITGTIMVGIIAVIAQMLPFGATVLGYHPYGDSLQRDQRLRPFCPDEFVIGLGKMLSAGSLSSGPSHTLGKAHDDLLRELFCARNTAGKNGRVDTSPESLKVLAAREAQEALDPWVKQVPSSPLVERADKQKIVTITVEVDPNAREPEGTAAKDWWLLPATHFRLVTQKNRSHYPVAYLVTDDKGQPFLRPAGIRDGRTEVASLIVQRKPSQGSASVIWVYRLPADEDPQYMVFRRVARAAVEKHDRPAATSPTTRPQGR